MRIIWYIYNTYEALENHSNPSFFQVFTFLNYFHRFTGEIEFLSSNKPAVFASIHLAPLAGGQ